MAFDAEYLSAREARVFREAMALRESGARVVGVYCAFTPKELIAAAGAIPVSLCAGSERPIPEAEAHLPRNLCPLIKSSYGFALTDSCPFFHEADLILADATCDGKKKMFELLGRLKPLSLLQLPQTAGTPESYRAWLGELHRVKVLLEEETGVRITKGALREQIALYNALRAAIGRLYALNQGPVPLVTGREIAVITDTAGFECNLPALIEEITTATAELAARAADRPFCEAMARRPRILLTGCPNTNRKVLHTIEEAGGAVVAMENCGGLKTASVPVDPTVEPMEALARRYLSIACPCMSPNTARLELLGSLADAYRVDGVVELTWQACHTYNIEAFQVREFVEGRLGKGYLQIETDYSENDIERIRIRIEAFLEQLS